MAGGDPHDGIRAASGGDARAVTLALLATRAPGATVCPSEVARALAAKAGAAADSAAWRGEMAAVHEAIDTMVVAGLVRLSWKGAAMAARAGPYRIGRAG